MTFPVSIFSSDDRIDELGRVWKEVVVALPRYYPAICLKGLRKTINLSEYPKSK
jgi:hypothetical protein